MMDFPEILFRESVNRAIEHVQSLLYAMKCQPRLAEDESHLYDDKFTLAEVVTNTSIASYLKILECTIGFDTAKFQTLYNRWMEEESKKDRMTKACSIVLRFQAEDSCTFLWEKELEYVPEIKSERSTVILQTTSTDTTSSTTTIDTKVKTMVKEYHWNIKVLYKFSLIVDNHCVEVGNDDNININDKNVIELLSRTAETVMITSVKQRRCGKGSDTFPFPPRTIHPSIDLNLNWLMKNIELSQAKDLSSSSSSLIQALHQNQCTTEEQYLSIIFFINREDVKECRTPSRNPDVEDALSFAKSLKKWSINVASFFTQRLELEFVAHNNPVNQGKTDIQYPSLISLSDDNDKIFTPILPVMDKHKVLDKDVLLALLKEQTRSINIKLQSLSGMFPPKTTTTRLITVTEAMIVTMSNHIVASVTQYCLSIKYIEAMLQKQLTNAIGHHITTDDFDEYMRFHNRKLFKDVYRPKTFSYAIRRPGCYPDGIIAIESSIASETSSLFGSIPQKTKLIETFVQKTTPRFSTKIPIDAATSVEIKGDRYIHGWLQHSFEDDTNSTCSSSNFSSNINLACRARQFSSFMVLVGNMIGPYEFEPKDAIILQNKDEVLIPLLLKVLPSAKEFKDAIESLSPKQQGFARRFRSMQLESSVFGVCVVQLKPQLERLLGLPDGALTKEIQLTQDLLSLFVDYQIPSDLLAFDENVLVPSTGSGSNNTSATTREKVEAVRGYVKSVFDVIDTSKAKQLKDAELAADMKYELEQPNRTSNPFDFGSTGVARVSGSTFGGTSSSTLFGVPQRCHVPSAQMCESLGIYSMENVRTNAKPCSAPVQLSSPFVYSSSFGMPVQGFGGAPLSATSTGGIMSTSTNTTGLFEGKREKHAKLAMNDNASQLVPSNAFFTNTTLSDRASLVDATESTAAVSKESTLAATVSSFHTPNESTMNHPSFLSNTTIVGLGDDTNKHNNTVDDDESSSMDVVDVTMLPKILEKRMESLNPDHSLHSTRITTGSTWVRCRHENLCLPSSVTTTLSRTEITNETKKAFDLLDALSRSGTFVLEHCVELHIVIGVVHNFEKNIITTVIQDNIDPIDTVEMSSILLASTIHNIPSNNNNNNNNNNNTTTTNNHKSIMDMLTTRK